MTSVTIPIRATHTRWEDVTGDAHGVWVIHPSRGGVQPMPTAFAWTVSHGRSGYALLQRAPKALAEEMVRELLAATSSPALDSYTGADGAVLPPDVIAILAPIVTRYEARNADAYETEASAAFARRAEEHLGPLRLARDAFEATVTDIERGRADAAFRAYVYDLVKVIEDFEPYEREGVRS